MDRPKLVFILGKRPRKTTGLLGKGLWYERLAVVSVILGLQERESWTTCRSAPSLLNSVERSDQPANQR